MNYGELFIKADTWIRSNCWIAVFDILGFRNIITLIEDNQQAFNVRVDYEETIKNLESSCNDYFHGSLAYSWFSDTFLIYTSDDSARSYTIIQSASKIFIDKCICSRIPIRGAIGFGSLMRTVDNRSFIGSAFLEAFEYAEDQDWIGLLLTPNAIKKVKSYGLDPTHHDFVQSDVIPMRKFRNHDILAFRFQNGAANFPSYLIPALCDMKGSSGDKYRSKYEKTEQFIRNNYKWITDANLNDL